MIDSTKTGVLIAAIFILSISGLAFGQTKGKPVKLPVRYDAHRFYVEPVTTDGEKLSFFTDTGGGLFVFADTVEKLKLPVESVSEGERKMELIVLPKFKAGTEIPAPLGATSEKIFVSPTSQRMALAKDWSGMLGQQWFAGRVWTFDYPNKQLLLRAVGDVPTVKPEHRAALGFKTTADGKRAINFPRITVKIDGEPLDLLFDTGASTELTEAALKTLNDKQPAVRGTSFITTSVFEKWRKAHPDWRVIEAAEARSNAAMIEVPDIEIGGYRTGAVWFTVRLDKNFHEYMSQWMDKRVEGAIGGNALRYFRITVDYPNAVAVFEK
ncbi:MAG: hypothetical protein M3209_13935 [Acidobacteriota bacterium]|nr:hypothetical protein [Acidobacteriota bacterium]